MRSQFEDEKEQFIYETNKKLEEFKTKIINQSDQSKKIQELESRLKDYQNQK